jgi:hypothetical protein
LFVMFELLLIRISVRLGLGFFYDLACDSIMISILIGRILYIQYE